MKKFSIAGSAIVLLLIVVLIVIVIQKGYIGVSYEQQIQAAISTTNELITVCSLKSGEIIGIKVTMAAIDQDGDGQQDTFLVSPNGQSTEKQFDISTGNFKTREIDFSSISFIPGVTGTTKEIGIGSIVEAILLHNLRVIDVKINKGFSDIIDILNSRGESSIAFKGKEEQLNRLLDKEDLLFGELDELYALLGVSTPIACKKLGIEDTTSDKLITPTVPVGGGGSNENGDNGGDDDGAISAVCGDFMCDAGEALTCPTDCGFGGGFCGDLICDDALGEDPTSCSLDCGGSPSPPPF